jgi:hypothetical protein
MLFKYAVVPLAASLATSVAALPVPGDAVLMVGLLGIHLALHTNKHIVEEAGHVRLPQRRSKFHFIHALLDTYHRYFSLTALMRPTLDRRPSTPRTRQLTSVLLPQQLAQRHLITTSLTDFSAKSEQLGMWLR